MTEGKAEVFPEGRWLTYNEIGKIRGIGRASAVKLVQREKWQRRPGNDRTARVLVPLDWLKPARRSQETFPEEFPEQAQPFREDFRELSRVASLLEAAITAVRERADAEVATLREQLGQVGERAEAERDRADRAEQRADRAEAVRDAADARADALRIQLAGAVEALKGADAQQAARRAHGVLARLRAALRGE